MGATVITGKRAAAFKAPAGDIIYVLFEETYEKNCYPHTPHWSCGFIGRLDGAMQRIFRWASGCEGGSLQSRNGDIKPENMIAGWLKELEAPHEMPDLNITLKIGTDSMYDAIPKKASEATLQRLSDMGRSDVGDRLAAGESVELSLHRDSDVIMAALGHQMPWRIIRGEEAAYHPRRPDLGYAPKPVKGFDVQVPAVLKVEEYERLLRKPDGTWYCAGWDYSVVGNYVAGLGEAELREPGSFRKRIIAYRETVKNSAVVPLEQITVLVDRSVEIESEYGRRSIAEFAEKHAVTATANGYSVQPTPASLWHLIQLPKECATWIVAGQAQKEPSEATSDAFKESTSVANAEQGQFAWA